MKTEHGRCGCCAHNHGHEHGHSHNHEHGEGVNSKTVIFRIAISAVLLIAGISVPMPDTVKIIIFAVSAIVVGYDVLFEAVLSIFKEHSLEESVLMTVASIGAFAIGEGMEGALVMLLFCIGELLQDMAVERSRKSISGLMDLRPDVACKLVDGKPVQVPAEEVKKGDIIIVSPGERIALDGIVKSGASEIDTSALTGESMPQSVFDGSTVLSGCVNLSGVITVEVTSEFADSTVSRILNMVESAESAKAKPEMMITRFARIYTPVVVCLALIIGVAVPLIGGFPIVDWLNRALVFLVISCPCALVISVPLTYFAGIGGASKRGILFKGADIIDSMSKTDTVAFDKTGTLTTGKFSVIGIESEKMSENDILQMAAYAEMFSNHPIAQSIISASKVTPDNSRVTKCREERGKGIVVELDGKTEVAAGNALLMSDLGISVVEPDSKGESVVYVAYNGELVGKIMLADTVKEDAAATVRQLKEIGVARIAVLTGDREEVACNIASQIGINDVYAECLPGDKAEKFKSLKTGKGKIVFVGDGINDAPVLAMADAGVAMGGLGADAAIEAADVVVMTDEPSKVAEAINVSRKTKKIVIQNISFSIACKVIIMILGLMDLAPMWLAVFADVGVALIAILNAMRAFGLKKSDGSTLSTEEPDKRLAA